MIIHKMLGNIEGPREKSRDIDSLTKDYPEEIIAAIKRIGEKYEANDPDGWLNNHWNRTKKYNDEFEFFIRWTKLNDLNLSNVNLYYADLEFLFMFKIRSVDDRINLARMEPREQDIIDVVSILRAFKISDPYFPNAVNYLIENGMVNGTKLKTEETQRVKFEDTEYGKRMLAQIQNLNLENLTKEVPEE